MRILTVFSLAGLAVLARAEGSAPNPLPDPNAGPQHQVVTQRAPGAASGNTAASSRLGPAKLPGGVLGSGASTDLMALPADQQKAIKIFQDRAQASAGPSKGPATPAATTPAAGSLRQP